MQKTIGDFLVFINDLYWILAPPVTGKLSVTFVCLTMMSVLTTDFQGFSKETSWSFPWWIIKKPNANPTIKTRKLDRLLIKCWVML